MSCTIFLRTGYAESQSNGCLVMSTGREGTPEEILREFAQFIVSWNLEGRTYSSCCIDEGKPGKFCSTCGRKLPSEDDYKISYDSFQDSLVNLVTGDADSIGGDMWEQLNANGWDYECPAGLENWILVHEGEKVLATLVKDIIKDYEGSGGEIELLHWKDSNEAND